MQNDVLNKRIRIDFLAIPPQLTNNNIRWKCDTQTNTCNLTPDYCDEYFKFNEGLNCYVWQSDTRDLYQSDELNVYGCCDFTLRLPPVPPGTYELRFTYSQWENRGIAQLFVDDEFVNIPVDLSLTGEVPGIGWLADSQTDDDGIENDKMMRNRGYMKGAGSVLCESGTITARQMNRCLRVILGKYTYQDYGYHTLRAKNVEAANKCFQLDYIEYVPTSYLAKEGRE